jgi:hypothetical protein
MIVLEFETYCPKMRQRKITEAVFYVGAQLLSRFRKPIYINIRTIRQLTEKQGVNGDCMDEGDREFTIRLDVSLPIEDLISTLMHEMVHVWQYMTGKLKQPSVGKAVFDKVDYDWDMEYDIRPWEIEAHAIEKQLKENWDGQNGY